MHGQSLSRRLGRRRDEGGAVAIIVAICMTLLCLVAALVLDFGLVKVDRQIDKSAADSAVLAGLHAMDFTGASSVKPFVGVCAALRFLEANNDRFSSVSESSGWSKGDGTAISGNACTNSALQQVSCSSTDQSTWAKYDATQVLSGLTYTIHIQNGYDFSDSSGWKEDSLAASTADHAGNPCLDMELTVNQTRKPGLGSLATSSNLVTGVRTVGRVQLSDGGVAPAMLLIKRTGCSPNPLSIGGSNSYIHVLGFAGGGVTQPGTIHTDDDGGNGCASNGTSQIFQGANVSDSIVAYAAPLLGNPNTPDPLKPGLVTSVYSQSSSANPAVTRDSFADVYGAAGVNAAASGTHNEVSGRAVVTRQPVDLRYLATIKTIVSNSMTSFALNYNNAASAHAGNYGYAKCANNGAIAANQIDNYGPAFATYAGLYVDCDQVTSVPGNAITGWKTIVFKGSIKLSGTTSLSLPDATKVYLAGSTGSEGAMTANSSFQMHTTGLTTPVSGFADGNRCVSTNSNDRALLVAKVGSLTVNGLLRACDTTMVLLGGETPPPVPGACLPTYDPAAVDVAPANLPTHSPCSGTNNGGAGTGQILANGVVDWTAPNNCTIVTSTSCDGTTTGATDGWYNPNGPEDLALWTESAAYGSINARIGGSSVFNLRGVFMTPNFDPLTVGGSAGTTLLNAQFIASALALNGGAQLNMTVDPNSAVTLKKLTMVGLVR